MRLGTRIILIVAGVALVYGIAKHHSNNSQPALSGATSASPVSGTAIAGFDLNKLGEVVRTSPDPATLEKAINDPGNSINNLDLDNDGNIDYLKVSETGKNQMTVIDDVSPDKSVTVATINVDPTSNQSAALNIQGNPQYVGDDYEYHSRFTFTDFLLLSYLMRPHSYYVPSYHYGYHPAYYHTTRVVNNYHVTSSPSVSRPSRSSLGSPSHSQRSFGVQDRSTPVHSGGFGHSTAPSGGGGFGSSHSSSNSYHPHSSSGRSSYGHSSFGRRR
jgi:hypothetical protein